MNALRLYYLAMYIGLGAVLPLLGLSLQARGLRPSEYAWLLALLPLSRMLAPPIWGALSDKWLGTGTLLRVNTLLTGIGMFVVSQSQSFNQALVGFVLWAVFGSSLIPLSEACTYQVLGEQSARFGYVRVFGSIGFAVSAICFGVFGVDDAYVWPFGIATAAYVLASLLSRGLPHARPDRAVQLRGALGVLLRRPDALLLWAASTLYYVAHGAFDMYFGPHVEHVKGVTPGFISACWAIGVVCEIALFFVVPRYLRSGSNNGKLLVFAALVAAARWYLLSVANTALAILCLAPFHAVTFGLWYLVFTHENQAAATKSTRATVQGLGATCVGLGLCISTLGGGFVLERFGGRVLFLLASITACVSCVLYALRLFVGASVDKRLAVQVEQT